MTKSLPILREALHISVSQTKAYLRCPESYRLRYVLGVPPAFVPINLAFGSAVHVALAEYYFALKKGRVTPLRELVAVFEAEWQRRVNGSIPLQAEEDNEVTDHLEKGAAMLAVFHHHASSSDVAVEAVELPFSIDLHDPETGELLEEKLIGAFDLVVREGEKQIVVEHKTAARKWTKDQLNFDTQASAYQLAAQQIGLGKVGLRFNIITKTKTPTVQLEDVERGPQDEDDFLRTVVGVLRAIDAGSFYPVRGWQCRTCAVAHACCSTKAVPLAVKAM